MSIDIKEGDFLVVSGVDYPVRSVSEYGTTILANTATFIRRATVDASTKRSPGVVAGKRGAPATYLTGLKCTPLDPVDSETRNRLALDAPHELKQAFLADDDGFLHVIIEELKR